MMNIDRPDAEALAPVETTPYLTKYECARLIGLRVLQLHEEGDGVADPWSTARRELREHKNPAIIRRYLSDGSYEDVSASKLKLDTFTLRFYLTDGMS
tara:strand:- start:55 stop:348 length:294 start_codon:yes stop_codon:yes gene_type:complete